MGYLFALAFGAVFIAAGGLIAWGLSRGLDERWAAALKADGYGTAEERRLAEQEHAEFARELVAWTLREEVRQASGGDEAALEALRVEAEDWEPTPPHPVPALLPEGAWARFAALSTASRQRLFVGLMVAPVFFAPGLFVAASALVELLRERRGARNVRRFPRRPWLHLTDWAALRGRSLGEGGSAALGLMVFVFGWAATCAGVMWALEPEPEPVFTGMTGAAVVIAALLGGLGARQALRVARFGRAELLLSQVPLEPGRPFTARLLVPRGLGGADDASATLCLERVTITGSGKQRGTRIVNLFSQRKEAGSAERSTHEGRATIDFRFDVPTDRPASRYGGESSFRWKLEVRAKSAGLRFEESFEVPVYPAGGDVTTRREW